MDRWVKPNTYEARQKLRAHLAGQRKKGPLSEAQEAAWWALNEVEQMAALLRKVERAGGLPEGLMTEIRVVLQLQKPGSPVDPSPTG